MTIQTFRYDNGDQHHRLSASYTSQMNRLMKQLLTDHLTADEDYTTDRYPSFSYLTAIDGWTTVIVYQLLHTQSPADTSRSPQVWSVVTSLYWPLKVANLVGQQGDQQWQSINKSTLVMNEITPGTHKLTSKDHLGKKKWCHPTYCANTYCANTYLTNHSL